MKRLFILAALAMVNPARASITSSECIDVVDVVPKVKHVTIVCSPGIPESDAVGIQLTPDEFASGTRFLSASAPLPIVATVEPDSARVQIEFNQTIGPLTCLPPGPGGPANRIVVEVNTLESVAVVEVWCYLGNVVAILASVLGCPPGPTGVDDTTFGRVKGLYR